MQVVFGGLREIMDEGIRAFDALKKVKFFLAGLAYQVVSGNDVAFTNKRFINQVKRSLPWWRK